MFIRLTRTDGLPIWLNASFIVTVEPARSGGSIVVPIGDGLDYDVKEAPETVLALLDKAPPAKVVPVPPPKSLTHTPDDVSPEVWASPGESSVGKPEEPTEEAEQTPSKRGRGRRSKTAVKKTEKKAEQVPEAAEMTTPADFDKIVADLKARKCRTARRMRNAIKSFFGKTDEAEIDRIIEAMINKGFLLIGADGHVDWTA